MNVQWPLRHLHTQGETIPQDVWRLFPREREIALSVYTRGCATAKDVEDDLSHRLTNPAIRSMLNRLVSKGMLTRQKVRRRREFVYAPALTEARSTERTLEQFAEDFFCGSVADVAAAIADLYAARMRS